MSVHRRRHEAPPSPILHALQHHEPDLSLRVVQTLVLYALCEHQLGHATRITVSVQGSAFSVSDNGRGHAVSRTIEGAPYLNLIYEHFQFPFGQATPPPVQLQGLGMSLLNQLCSRLEVVVRKPANTLRICFEGGALVAHDLADGTNPEGGNTVAGSVMPSLSSRPIGLSALAEWLEGIQRVNPLLEIVLNGRPVGGAASTA